VLLGKRGRVELRLCGEFGGPVAAGVLRPVVFLPPAWHAWDAATRRAVLLHELTHHARRDPLRRWVAALACAIHWWNPLVRWMARRLHEQCEFACDARVVAAGVRVERYTGLLCDLAAAKTPPHAAVGMAERSTLERRVRRLVEGQRPGWSGALVAALVAATLVAGLGFALLRPARTPPSPAVPRSEVELRLTAEPFPAE
jgi:beta-lactamase regulating signal transducer with metallopeptidase domain